jgi:DnaK suppressor protein
VRTLGTLRNTHASCALGLAAIAPRPLRRGVDHTLTGACLARAAPEPGGLVRPQRICLAAMDDDRARELLAAERRRVEAALASSAADVEETAEQEETGERDSEDLYEKELDVGRAGDLAEQLAALERAEQRLADGTYGRSVLSGDPIPDERLEARPTAELTVEEQRAQAG